MLITWESKLELQNLIIYDTQLKPTLSEDINLCLVGASIETYSDNPLAAKKQLECA